MNCDNHKTQWMGAYILLGILAFLIIILIIFLWPIFTHLIGLNHSGEEISENIVLNNVSETPILDLFKEQKYPGVPSIFNSLTFGMSKKEVAHLPLGPPPWKDPSHPGVSFVPEFSEDLFTGLKFETSSRLPSAEKLEMILGLSKKQDHTTFFKNQTMIHSSEPRWVWFTPNTNANSTKPSTCLTYDNNGLRWHYCKTAVSWFSLQWGKASSPTCSFTAKKDKLWPQLQKCQSFAKIDKNRFLIPSIPGFRSPMIATLYLGAKQEFRSFKVQFPYSEEYPSKRIILPFSKRNFPKPMDSGKQKEDAFKVFFEEGESITFKVSVHPPGRNEGEGWWRKTA